MKKAIQINFIYVDDINSIFTNNITAIICDVEDNWIMATIVTKLRKIYFKVPTSCEKSLKNSFEFHKQEYLYL